MKSSRLTFWWIGISTFVVILLSLSQGEFPVPTAGVAGLITAYLTRPDFLRKKRHVTTIRI